MIPGERQCEQHPPAGWAPDPGGILALFPPRSVARLILAGWLLGAGGAWGATYYWDDGSGDHLWSTPANWSSDTKPGSGDTAIFNDTRVGTNIVDADFPIDTVIYSCSNGIYYLQISNGVTLTPEHLTVGQVTVNTTNTVEVRVSGGGTLAFKAGATTYFYLGSRSANPSKVYGVMTVSGAVFNTDNLVELRCGSDFRPDNSATGHLDLSQATIVADGQTNTLFRVGTLSSSAGLLRVGQNYSDRGILVLPPTITNILVWGELEMGASYSEPMSWINLGTLPQLKQLTVTRDVTEGKMDVIYNNGSGIVTGWPPNIQITLGIPDAPSSLYLGAGSGGIRMNTWQAFQRFESYLSNLSLGTPGGANTGNVGGELDVTATNTTELVGSITFSNVSLYKLALGYPSRAEGRLKLPPSVETISMNTLHLGSKEDGVGYSYIDLGTNSQLRSLVVTNEWQMSKGRFLYWDAGGCHTGLPATACLQVGASAASRGSMVIGGKMNDNETTLTDMSGLGGFQAYLTNLTVGSGSYSNYPTTGILDCRGCTSFSMDVDGPVNLGTNKGGVAYVYLPAGQARTRWLNVGAAGAVATNNNLEGYLWMSNTTFTVTDGLALGDPYDTNSPGIISNCLYGISGGIDLQTNVLTVTNGGRMVVNFNAEAADSKQIYWGFRMLGDQRALLQAMTNASPPSLTYDLSGLSEDSRRRFGIYYVRNMTYVGVMPPAGSIFMMR